MTEQDVDIVDRLRDTSHGVRLSREAAAEIERLKVERSGYEARISANEKLALEAHDRMRIQKARAEKAEAERDAAYARGIEDAARHIESVMFPNAERAKIVAAIRALAPDPEER